MQRIELLAPAGSLESGLAAINSGADAVYIGASRFGARQAAGNPLENIEALAKYAHRFRARVYVTLNTLLYDEELPAAVTLAHQLYQAGVDALIIQDVGLLEAGLPPLPLIASTQMHNHTAERVAFLEKVGFQRAILARELSLAQIRDIRQQTSLELETFIHGALCVSYSGQCYLSYALGGRSGNRGECAQPCRKRYMLLDGEGRSLGQRYWLSLGDLNLSQHLAELLQAGVTSFKIEGRLKDCAYVTNITAHYRRLLDGIFAGGGYRPASSGRSFFDFVPDPHKTFNRGYSTYFFNGRPAPSGRGTDITSQDTPKSLGELLGKVLSLGKDFFTLERSIEVQPGDGLCFFDPSGKLTGTQVQRVDGERITPARMDGLGRGMEIYRNHDQAFLRQLEKSMPFRKISVSLRLSETAGGIALSAVDEDGTQVTCEVACEKTLAQKPDLARRTIEKQLGSLGESLFEAENIEIDLPEMLFLPVALLNRLRRETIELLENQREMERLRPQGGTVPNNVPDRGKFPWDDQREGGFPQTRLDYRGNVLNRQAEAFYRRHGVQNIEPAAESGLDLHGRVVMTTKLCLKYELGACPRLPNSANLCAPFALMDEDGQRLELRFDCIKCQMEVILA